LSADRPLLRLECRVAARVSLGAASGTWNPSCVAEAQMRTGILVLSRSIGLGKILPDQPRNEQNFTLLKTGRDWPVSAVKLVDDLAGESPASASFPVGAVVISGDGAGDQAIGSPEVNVLVGWV
jgi:hypothetical protein